MTPTHVEHRLLGSPGCGKTTRIAEQVGNIIDRYGMSSCLIASFTRAGAVAIADKLAEVGLEVDRNLVGTMHSVCYRNLHRPTIAESKISEFSAENPVAAITDKKVDPDDPYSGCVDPSSPGASALEEYNLLRNLMRPREVWPGSATAFAEKWERWKDAKGYMDFTDLLEYHLQHDGAPMSPRFIILDEAQDCTPLQFALARHWAASAEYVQFTGDDDQTLFQFLGASPELLLDPPLAPEFVHVLDQSHRLPRAVHAVAGEWIKHVSRRQEKVFRPRDAEGEVRREDFRADTPETIIADLMRYHAEGKTIMLLTSCSYMLDPLKAALKAAGLAFHNLYRSKRGDWNPLGAGRGTSMLTRLLTFLRTSRAAYGADARMWTCSEIDVWGAALEAEGVFIRGGKRQLDALATETRLATDDDLAKTFLPEVQNYLTFGADEENERDDLRLAEIDFYERHCMTAKKKALEFPLLIARRRGIPALREEPRITIGTVHSVKGGEGDAVFLFPDLSLAAYREWETAGATRDAIRRLFYVGMSRARESLILCAPSQKLAVEW